MPNPVLLTLTPSFGSGLGFNWTVYNGMTDSLPWSFYVEFCETGDSGPWIQVAGPLTTYAWQDPQRLIISRDAPRFYRVKLVTPEKAYWSAPVSINGTLSSRRFKLAKEIMRREMVYAIQNTNSMEGNVYVKNVSGPPCTTCLDPVTGSAVYGSDCPQCGGTKFTPPYLGPYPVWATFTPNNRTTTNADDGLGRVPQPGFRLRIAGTAWLRTGDILKCGGSLYYIETVDVVVEIGQLPIVQVAGVNKLPLGDPLYVLEIFK